MRLYNIPIIQQDLRHEETIIQAVNALDCLQQVIQDVFNRIDSRIAKNTIRLNELNSRISSASSKVESLIGVNKSIKIFSPAKYPGESIFHDIPKTFSIENHEKIDYKKEYNVESGLDPVNHKTVQEKLEFFHVKTKNERKEAMNEILSIPNGLGELPDNIESVNSLLLYNKNQNPYESYVSSNPLDVTVTVPEIPEPKEEKMEAAPFSITNKKILSKTFVDSLLYAPGMNEAPRLEVPEDLPDLPGIADDINFDITDTDIAIAPSNKKKSIFTTKLESNEIGSDSEDILPKLLTDNKKSVDVSKSNEVNLQKDEKKNESKSNSIQTQPPPPPPPPMPPVEVVKLQTSQKTNSENTTPVIVPPPSFSDSARSNLMEAIRQAGGKSKLKPAKSITTDDLDSTKSVSSKPAPKSSGDLMADLHNKLLMRRKGISGNKGAGNVLDSVSALIPPPPRATEREKESNTETSDEDWE